MSFFVKKKEFPSFCRSYLENIIKGEDKMSHQKSLMLEMAARKALNLETRGGLCGVIDADYIDKVGNAFTVLIAALSPYYKDGSPETIQKIRSFLKKYSYLDSQEISKEEYFSGVEASASELRSLLEKI